MLISFFLYIQVCTMCPNPSHWNIKLPLCCLLLTSVTMTVSFSSPDKNPLVCSAPWWTARLTALQFESAPFSFLFTCSSIASPLFQFSIKVQSIKRKHELLYRHFIAVFIVLHSHCVYTVVGRSKPSPSKYLLPNQDLNSKKTTIMQ